MTPAPLMERRRPEIALAAMVLANLVPLFGVLFLDWDVGSLVVLYWSENLVIGGYTILKMLLKARGQERFLVLFFTLHYGGFCAIHGFFVLQLTRFAGEDWGHAAALTWPGPLAILQTAVNLAQQLLAAAPREFLLACLALVVSHGVSFVLIYLGQREYQHTTMKDLMNAPYRRIAVLHIAIIAGGFLVVQLGSPLGLLVALVALKIGMDVMLHNRSHASRRQAADSAAPMNESPGE
ncbi:MAG: DUF6498-containing protein [Gammaproteobacteria bacterium]